MSTTMRKPKKVTAAAPTERLVPQSQAPECECCKAIRILANRPNATVVYATRGRVRYVKCKNCGNNFKWIPPLKGE